MTENQALTIAKAYWTGHGINFRALQAHIEDRLGDLDGGADFDTLSASAGVDTWVNEGSGGDGAAAEAADPTAAPSPREAQLLALEAKLSLQVAQHRTRVRDFFVDFDPKRVGLVTPLQVSVLPLYYFYYLPTCCCCCAPPCARAASTTTALPACSLLLRPSTHFSPFSLSLSPSLCSFAKPSNARSP
jgi:hypothetical protein